MRTGTYTHHDEEKSYKCNGKLVQFSAGTNGE